MPAICHSVEVHDTLGTLADVVQCGGSIEFVWVEL